MTIDACLRELDGLLVEMEDRQMDYNAALMRFAAELKVEKAALNKAARARRKKKQSRVREECQQVLDLLGSGVPKLTDVA